jgi:uncharacterized protein (TIGR02145 family)
MRNNKNNITLGLENIILFSRNITSHFTGKAKIITLVSIIIILSFVNITLCSSSIFYNTNVSALSYSSNVGIGFNFNPSISVSISPSNLVIDNLTPSITADSNTITVSVATNAAYGYTLSAMANGNNSNNSNLTHTNGTSIFSSIATDASLSSLTNDNTWGYSYRLSSSGNSNAWSNYSGLSNETSKTLVNTDSQAAKPIDFKIAAKASETQPSGAYTGTINFTAVSKVGTISLLDAFVASNATMQNGYYTMQGMTPAICNAATVGSSLQLLDVRDGKLYWVTKLADNNCWMTQNLDLDLDSNRTYTHYDTDLGWETLNESATWQPTNSTINTTSKWQNSSTEPYSADLGNIYYYTSNSDATDIKYNSLDECLDAEHSDCDHYHAGNYYNYPAALAGSTQNSICPKGWKLPGLYAYRDMLEAQGVYSRADDAYTDDGSTKMRTSPVYLMRSGSIYYQSINSTGVTGFYHISYSGYGSVTSKRMSFNAHSIRVQYGDSAGGGISIRCLAR